MPSNTRIGQQPRPQAHSQGLPAPSTIPPPHEIKQQPIIGRYTIPRGATLWQIAGRAYPGHADRKKVEWIVNANPGMITNPNYIQAGWTIVVPPVPSHLDHIVVVEHEPASSPMAAAPLPTAAPRITLPETETSSEPTMAIALPDSSPMFPIIFHDPTPHVLLANTTGYRIVITTQVAVQSRIPLKGNFDAQIFLYESELEKTKGWFSGELFHINAYVHTKNKETTISFALKELPSRPFMIVIAGNDVDGNDFAKSAQPFTGKFPGPNGFARKLGVMGRVMVPYAIASVATANPIPLFIGVGHATIPTVTAALLRRSADRIESRAQAKLQKALAENKKLLDAPIETETPVISAALGTTRTEGGL